MFISERDRRGFVDASTAAALLGLSVDQVRSARGHHKLGREYASSVSYGPYDLLVVALRGALKGAVDVTPEQLRRHHGVVRVPGARPDAPGFTIDVREHARWIVRCFVSFRRGARRVVSDPEIMGGAPVFAGTRIPVEQVGHMLLGGDSEEELLKDFPSLNRDDLAYARAVVARGNGRGRPRKPIELRR